MVLQTTPDTTAYMILGYVITVAILVALVAYLVLKRRQLQTEIRQLESLTDDQA